MKQYILVFIVFLGAVPFQIVKAEVDNRTYLSGTNSDSSSEQDSENVNIINELKSRGADVRLEDLGVVINLPGILFATGKSDLSVDAKKAIAEIAQTLIKYPQRKIAIEGHTDNVGTVLFNKELSQNRAVALFSELKVLGIDSRRMSIYGFGESRPLASNKTDYGKKRNRRVEVIVQN